MSDFDLRRHDELEARIKMVVGDVDDPPVDPEPAPVASSPTEELLSAVPERIGRIIRASRATGLIRPSSHPTTGTGFLISSGLLITNNHVMNGNPQPGRPTGQDEATGTVTFGYADNMYGTALPTETYDLDPRAFFMSSLELDFVIVGVKNRPGARWGTLPLPTRASELKKRNDVFVVQHPEGGKQQLGIISNTIQEFNETLVQYSTDTEPGASGAPVLDRTWSVVGLHHRGDDLPGAETGKPGARNEAIRADAIWEHAKSELEPFLKTDR